jgi:hypothetical protein
MVEPMRRGRTSAQLIVKKIRRPAANCRHWDPGDSLCQIHLAAKYGIVLHRQAKGADIAFHLAAGA